MRKAPRSIVGVLATVALAGTIAASPANASTNPQVEQNTDGSKDVIYPITDNNSKAGVVYEKGVQPQLSGGKDGNEFYVKLSPKDVKAAKSAAGGAAGWVVGKLAGSAAAGIGAGILAPYFADIPCKADETYTIRWKPVNAPEPYNYKVTGTKCG
ncbi:hypothetical protein QYM46_05120 [Brevibacterium sp. K11IcPPYGO002]|uniref:hypothetical protein n=1 Tax=Brevibacterium sp. K11IcPPYGO002 TaxID=3058837 RepID=UPI003D813803